MKHRKRRLKRKVLGKPVIGITCEVVKRKPYFSEFDLSCDYRYVRAIIRAGGIPILVPVNPFRRDVANLLDSLNGLVIIGGADIHPSFYKEKSREKVTPMYRGRTYFEMDLYRNAQKKKIPILAICYGMQLLNVLYGGTLYQDIQTEVKEARDHRSRRRPLHRVDVQIGSLCHKIFRKKSFLVHSQHHQAIKIPGQSLQITAYSEDGIPEAVEGPPHTIGVQWHPERQPKDPIQIRIFKHFLHLARINRGIQTSQK